MKLTLSLAVLTLAAAVLSAAVHDKDVYYKQKKIAQLLSRPQQPTYFKEIIEIGNTYDIFANLNLYKNTTRVKEFLFRYKHDGFMYSGKVFNVFEQKHLEQARMLFDMFYYANDFEVFYKTACWARNRMHPGMFVYALSVAVTHREDLQGVTVPPPYETYPHLFVTSDVIQKAYQAKMRGYQHYEEMCDIMSGNKCVFYANHTNYYNVGINNLNSYKALSYFTEDIGLNAFYTYWHLEHPFWLGYEFYGKQSEHVGELFLYSHHQILARYYLERLSHGLGKIESLHYWNEIAEGYMPHLRYTNGLEMVSRPEYTTFNMHNDELFVYETRIVDAIDSGYIFTPTGQKLSLYEEKGVNYLGEIIQGYADSVNKPYYGQLYNFLRYVTGYVTVNQNKQHYEMYPSVMHHFATVLRDPLFYRLYKRIDNLYYRFIAHKNAYTTEELTFQGVSVKNFEVEKLVTYFDQYDTSLSYAVEVANEEDAQKVDLAARHFRLNHEPYKYQIQVDSDKQQNVMVRIFLGPKFDNHGMEMNFEDSVKYFVEMDRFPYMLKAGKTVIERSSHESTVFVQDYKPYDYYFQETQTEQFQRMCGFPERLALPRGSQGGVAYTMFVMVTPYNGKDMEDSAFYGVPMCGAHYHQSYPDDLPMGYPFNRPVENMYTFYTPNMYFKDVLIYHKPHYHMEMYH